MATKSGSSIKEPSAPSVASTLNSKTKAQSKDQEQALSEVTPELNDKEQASSQDSSSSNVEVKAKKPLKKKAKSESVAQGEEQVEEFCEDKKVKAKEQSKGKAKSKSKVKGKEKDNLFSHEAIEAHANAALNFNAPVLLVPIRHHSLSIGLHLPRIIDAYQPDLIAVEMPYVCQDEVKNLANENVVPPIAFFSYGTVKSMVWEPEDENDSSSPLIMKEGEVSYRHIYPMLAHSPEYVAFTEALKRNIAIDCIDLGFNEKQFLEEQMKNQAQNVLIKEQEAKASLEPKVEQDSLSLDEDSNESSSAEANKESKINSGPSVSSDLPNAQDKLLLLSKKGQVSTDELEFSGSDIYEALYQESGDLSFEEYWDRNFEVNALVQDTKTFLHNVYAYCYCFRKGHRTDSDISMVQRELFMLKKITAAQKQYKRILVLTGGMHSVALCDYLYFKKKKVKPVKFPKYKGNCYLVPYSFKSADAQSEYAAGIVFPFYYHKLYRAISLSTSFNPDVSSVFEPQESGYVAKPKFELDSPYWQNPLDAVVKYDNELFRKIDGIGNKDDKDSDPKKNKDKKDKKLDNTITPSGRLSHVLQTIQSLGSVKDQAKIKDPQELSQKILEAKGKLGLLSPSISANVEWPSDDQIKVVLNEEQINALLSYKVEPQQLINAFDATNFFFTRKIKDYRQKKMSTAEQIDCQVMLKGLASLRDKFAPSVYELIDAVKSTFIKEEFKDQHYVLLNLLKALTTVSVGRIPLDVNVPPLWRDFVEKARKFGLKTDDDAAHKANIDVFKDEKNILKGQFFSQVAFLCPEFLLNNDTHSSYNYIKKTETYYYRYSDELVMSIIESATLGDSLPVACEAKLKDMLEQGNLGLERLCMLFKSCINMGIENQFNRLKELIKDTVFNEHDLNSIALSLDHLNDYALIAKSTAKNQHIITELISLVLNRALSVLSELNDVYDEELDNFIDSLLKLNYYFNKYEFITNDYYRLLDELSCEEGVGSKIQGACVSLLFKNNRITYDEFEHFVDQFVYGSIMENNDCIGFFYTVLKISKASIFYRNGILQLLNAYIASLQGEEFLKVLVMLRRSFASFSKEELLKVVNLLKKIHGIAQTSFEFEVSAQEFAQNRIADRNMFAQLVQWLPLSDLKESALKSKDSMSTPKLVEQITGQDLSRSTLLSKDKRPNRSSLDPLDKDILLDQ